MDSGEHGSDVVTASPRAATRHWRWTLRRLITVSVTDPSLLSQRRQIKVFFVQGITARGPHKQRLFPGLVMLRPGAGRQAGDGSTSVPASALNWPSLAMP
jgi:hypothetical protein